MFKILKESFKITNTYISIATPLILFSLISSLYLIFSARGSQLGILFNVFLFFLMLCAFLSGWFHMIKTAVKDFYTDNTAVLSEFTAGIGEYFLSTIGMVVNIFITSLCIIVAAILIGKNVIGTTGIDYNQIINATTNMESMKAFVSSLSQEQLIKINKWNLLLLFSMFFNYFVILFYAPVVFFKQKNPFIALILSIKDLICRHFIKNIALFLIIVISYIFMSLTTSVCGTNIFAHFIMTLIGFYYATFIAIFVFNYYYSNYIKVGATIDKTV